MPTMLDVAKHAGVALSTVSYATNGTRPISKEARQRIFVAAVPPHLTQQFRPLLPKRVTSEQNPDNPIVEKSVEITASMVPLISE